MKNNVKKYIKLVGNVISVLSIIFILVAIRKLGIDFDAISNWPRFLLVVVLCVGIKTATVFIMATAWADWLHLFGKCEINKNAATCAYVKANIGKYLPGNVMHYVERNLFASNLGISQKKMAVGTILEVIGLTGIAFSLAVFVSSQYLLGLFQQVFGTRLLLVKIAFIGGCITAGILVLFFSKKIILFITECGWRDFGRTFIIAIVKYAAVLGGLGIIMVFLYGYMGGELGVHTSLLIISGYIIAWVVGFVIPGASGGIGVRELAITALLGPIVGVEQVLFLSIIHRLITIIGDFVSYLLVLFRRFEYV